MNGINEIWNQSLSLCKTMLDVAGSMIPGSGSKGKEAASAVSQVAECTCTKPKTMAVVNPWFTCMAPGAQSMVRVAGISGALAVGLGAYGAHVIMLNDQIPDEQKHSYRTANMYHFVGTFGLVASALGKRPMITGILMATGTILFCGSCYIHGMTGDSRVKKFAPLGGTTLNFGLAFSDSLRSWTRWHLIFGDNLHKVISIRRLSNRLIPFINCKFVMCYLC